MTFWNANNLDPSLTSHIPPSQSWFVHFLPAHLAWTVVQCYLGGRPAVLPFDVHSVIKKHLNWCQGQSVSTNFVSNFIVALTPTSKVFSTPENAFCNEKIVNHAFLLKFARLLLLQRVLAIQCWCVQPLHWEVLAQGLRKTKKNLSLLSQQLLLIPSKLILTSPWKDGKK